MVNINNKINFYIVMLIIGVLIMIAIMIYTHPPLSDNRQFLLAVNIIAASALISTGICGAGNASIERKEGVKSSKLLKIFFD